jgi:ABC-type multidrug transport system fused ATPase/permease subunit
VLKAYIILKKKHKVILGIIVISVLLLTFIEFINFFFLQQLIGFFSSSQIQVDSAFYKNLPKNLYTNIKHLLIFFFIFFIIRCLLILIVGLLKSKLCRNINDYLSNKIYSNYLINDYYFFTKNSSSDLISNIILEVDKFAYRIVDAIIIIFTETLVILGIVCFLLLNYFNVSFVLITLIIIIFSIFNSFYKNKFKKIGELKILYDSKKHQDLQRSFHVIQNIKLDGLEDFFLNKFQNSTKAASRSYFFLQFLNEIPKPIIELFIIIIMSIIVFIAHFFFNFSKTEILVMVSLYGVSMFRLLPSFNRLLIAGNSLRYYFPTVNKIFDEVSDIKNINLTQEFKEDLIFKKSIIFNNVNFSYSNSNKMNLTNVNIEINKNDIIGITGDSGSGKSTFLNLLLHLLKPNSGRVLVDNIPLENIFTSFRKKVGYVPQKIYLTDQSLIENVLLGKDIKDYNYPLFWDCVEKTNLKEIIDNLPQKENTKLGDRGSVLSGGQQQRIGIARALYKRSDILILDEATNSLDKNSENEILNTIYKLKANLTIIIVSHSKDVLSRCDKIFKVDNNKIFQLN